MQAVAYYRVSTKRQGNGGLGLEAQKTAVSRFARANQHKITNEFVEVETGTNKRRRPILNDALAAAKESGAMLLIAKLDRLSRNVHFISGLIESKVQFVAVDVPQVTNLTIHILAAVAEEEARLISQRTKAALAAAKARGQQLGNPDNLTMEAQQLGAAANRAAAIEAYAPLVGYIELLRDTGATYENIAARLNREGHRTRNGRLFHSMTIKRIADRADIS
jgi:DNA invertase Pin-like site-specific DNA recombinase